MTPTNRRVATAIAKLIEFGWFDHPLTAEERADIVAVLAAADAAAWCSDMSKAPRRFRIIMQADYEGAAVWAVGEGYFDDVWRWAIDKSAEPNPDRWCPLPIAPPPELGS